MSDLSIEKFDPTSAEIAKLVDASKLIACTDPSDKEQVKKAHEHRMVLRNTRVAITKKGKELREEAVAFSKAVIGKEKELIAAITPEEERLEAFEDVAAEAKKRAERLAYIPEWRAKLATIGDEVTEPTDDELLAMEPTAFDAYYNRRVSDKNDAVARKNQERDDAIRAEEQRIQREKDRLEAEENGRKQERERAEGEERRKAQQERDNRFRARAQSLERLGFRFDYTTKIYAIPGVTDLDMTWGELDEDTDEQFGPKLVQLGAEIARRKEVARQEAEKEAAELKRLADEKAADEEKARVEKDTKYQDFLKEHGYDGSDSFHVSRTDIGNGKQHVTLWKRAGDITI